MSITSPESLNCPSCGASVSSDKTSCEFCRSRLKTAACPSCLGLLFLGSRFCSHCGNPAVNIKSESVFDGTCPRCKTELSVLQIAEVHLRECDRCSGIWSDIQTFEDLCSNKEQQAAVLGYHNASSSHKHPQKISYVPCPDCSHLMNRSNFARISGVIIDSCKSHGVWFDADELPKIVEFINAGGLARSRAKERIEIDHQLSRLKDEQRKLAAMERRSGGARPSSNDSGSWISALFDF